MGGFSLKGAGGSELAGRPGHRRPRGYRLDKSLIRQDPTVTAEARYVMLETIREFAHEQFMASGDANAVRAARSMVLPSPIRGGYMGSRHLPEMAGRAEPPLATEYDNVRAA